LKEEVELLLIVLLDPVDTGVSYEVFAVWLLEILVEPETLHLITTFLGNVVKHLLSIFFLIGVGSTNTGLVGPLGTLSARNFDVAFDDSA
jgi:hypothetical protein